MFKYRTTQIYKDKMFLFSSRLSVVNVREYYLTKSKHTSLGIRLGNHP